jgi:CDP-diacylglycerol--inositol 3-phosphatidyltransferase
VGYLRIILLIGCYFYKDHQFEKFAILYFISFVLDYFDGLLARAFKQTSKYGGLLDMLTDRMGTLVLYFINFELMAKAPFQCALRNGFDNLHG